MKKILIAALLCACSPLICGGEQKSDNTVLPKGSQELELDAILGRIMRANRAFETLSFRCLYLDDVVDKGTEPVQTKSVTLYWKKSARACVMISEFIQKDIYNGGTKRSFQYLYYNNGRMTNFEKVVRKKNDKTPEIFKMSEEAVQIYPSIDLFMDLANSIHRLTAIPSGGTLVEFLKNPDRGKLKYKTLDYKGKKCLSLDFFGKNETTGRSEYVELLFDVVTGRLLRRTATSNPDTENSMKSVIEIEQYLAVKDIFFPLRWTTKLYDAKGELYSNSSFEFDKKSIKVDEPIPDSVFIPVLKEGALVRDRILKKEYYATGLSEEEKEKIISKDLDKIFEESEK